MINSLMCNGAPTQYIFYSSDIPHYIYYIFLPSIIITLLLGFFVLLKNKREVSAGIFFVLTMAMAFWMISMLGNWAQNNSQWSVFFDELNVLVGLIPVIFIYFILYAFYIDRKHPLLKNILIFIPILPILILLPSKINVQSIETGWCETISGKLYGYLAVILIAYASLAFYLLIKKIREFKERERKKQVGLVLAGFIVWTIVSVFMGVLMPLFQYPTATLWAPISCTVFAVFITWSIVKYGFLNIKTIAAQVLTVVVWILIGSEFFFIQNTTNRILTGIILFLTVIFGIMLIKSIRLEVLRKEELQIMSDKLANANDQLRKLDNAKSEFISIASHQLRTPLTAIKGFISLLLEGTYGKVEPKVRDALNKVYLSNERMVQLVENLLNISRIESGRLEFDFKKWKVEEILNELRDTFFISAKSKGLSLDFEFPDYSLPETEIDGPKVREVISNLIDNALKYTNRGGVTVNAELITDNKRLATKNEQFVRITISDTGIGVPKTELPYIFTKFSRGKDTKRLHVGGTGLGLYVGKSIIEAHHGRIWAESEGEGMGSKFIIEVPVSQEK